MRKPRLKSEVLPLFLAVLLKRRAWDSNPQPVNRRLISNQVASQFAYPPKLLRSIDLQFFAVKVMSELLKTTHQLPLYDKRPRQIDTCLLLLLVEGVVDKVSGDLQGFP